MIKFLFNFKTKKLISDVSKNIIILKRNDENSFNKSEIQDFKARSQSISQDKIVASKDDSPKKEENKK